MIGEADPLSLSFRELPHRRVHLGPVGGIYGMTKLVGTLRAEIGHDFIGPNAILMSDEMMGDPAVGNEVALSLGRQIELLDKITSIASEF
jgi:hypothetical protein